MAALDLRRDRNRVGVRAMWLLAGPRRRPRAAQPRSHSARYEPRGRAFGPHARRSGGAERSRDGLARPG